MRFVKSILNVGKLQSPDGEVDVTTDRLRQWETNFRGMSGKGLVIPIDWDHADDPNTAVPLGLGDYQKHRSAKNSVGRLVDFRVAGDGKSAEITLDVEKNDAAESAEKNLVFVSPVIHPKWRDGDGDEYNDCITHVDFVNHPVEHRQSPFEPVNDQPVIACSMVRTMSAKKPAAKPADDKKKAQRLATDEGGDGGDSGPDEGDGEGGMNPAKMVAKLGEKLGVELPEGVAAESESGMVAILTVVMSKLDDEVADEMGDEPADEETTVADPMMMSLQKKIEKLEQEKDASHRESLGKDIEQLVATGRMSPADGKKYAGELDAVKLSLNGKGSSKVEAVIEHCKGLEAGAVWPAEERAKKLSLDTADHPLRRSDAELTEDEVKSAVDYVLGRKPAK